MNNWVDEFYHLHPAFCREILKIVVMYCPEGPFLWFGPEEASLAVYQQWSPVELHRLLGRPCWLLDDFVPKSKQSQVMTLMSKIMAVSDTILVVTREGTAISMLLCFTAGGIYEIRISTTDILEDPEVYKFYLETITKRIKSRDCEFPWPLDAVPIINEDDSV